MYLDYDKRQSDGTETCLRRSAIVKAYCVLYPVDMEDEKVYARKTYKELRSVFIAFIVR